MQTPDYDMGIFARARAQLARVVRPDEAVVLSAQPLQVRNNDVHHPWRQDSDFFYFTGFEEPGAVYVLPPSPVGKPRQHIVFVQAKNPKLELWEGFRYGPQGAKEHFALDKVLSLSHLRRQLPQLLAPARNVYYKNNIDAKADAQILDSLKKNRHTFESPDNLLANLRVIKSPTELQYIKRACEISSRAHIELMRHTRPGQTERTLHGVFIHSFMSQGAAREAYPSIVATGHNACTLHYVRNSSSLKKGELLLVDAGCEYNMYASDITRTYPVTGRFSPVQKKLYTALLEVQCAIIKQVRPGATWKQLQNNTVEALVDVICDFKLLKASKRKIIDNHAYKQFYPHGVGHWLGLDVHDAGGKKNKTKKLSFQPGMCLTIEPGLYIPADTPGASDDLRGLGIRIEDDVVVTSAGANVLTDECPKRVRELEKLIGTA